jgi:ubiquinol-cytochrome c reductase cytochrome c1 subunit
MARILSILVGLFFTVALLWSFGLGFYTWATDPAAGTAEQVYHHHPKDVHFASDGGFGKFDRQQLQRGFQVYKEVCSACHSLSHVAFRDLEQLGYSEAEVKAIAAGFTVPGTDPNTGEATTRPDLSLMTKARHNGPAYVYSLLTGYEEQPADLVKNFPEAKTPSGLHYNPYFANLNLAMAPPLAADGQVEYGDGTKSTVDQMAKDVASFLIWTAEPKLEKRKQTGWAILGFLLFATILGYMSYRNIWADKKH